MRNLRKISAKEKDAHLQKMQENPGIFAQIRYLERRAAYCPASLTFSDMKKITDHRALVDVDLAPDLRPTVAEREILHPSCYVWQDKIEQYRAGMTDFPPLVPEASAFQGNILAQEPAF